MKEEMKVFTVSEKEYEQFFKEYQYIYNSIYFSKLNSYKTDRIDYIVFKNSKYRLGIILGYKDNQVSCPFSAPFGSFSFINKKVSIDDYIETIKVLDEYLIRKQVKSIKLTLPPMFYDEVNISKSLNALFNNGYKISAIDLNYQYYLHNFNDNYINNLKANARRNLNIALRKSLNFKKCTSKEMNTIAYNIIKVNRENKGYPLKMTYEQIEETSFIIKQDFFLISYLEEYIASAVVFQVNKKTVQVIYWGDRPNFADLKPMNFLSYKIFEYYKEQEIEVVDIGSSSENGIPNYGLCDFKESIGCDVSSKFIMEKKYLSII